MLRFKGSDGLRMRLVLATLAGRSVRVDDIRARDDSPGLRDYEASLLRLLEKVSSGCVVEINETGTCLRYRPGLVVGGADIVHDCGAARSLGYFLEPLVLLGLFAKRPLHITLRGVTNCDGPDACVDTFRAATLPLLQRFGADASTLELKVIRRGAPPLGGGEVILRVAPPAAMHLVPALWTDEGMVKRVRGVAYCARVAPAAASRMVDAARGVLNALLADVYIFVDHFSGAGAGRSPGFGLTLVAETTTGCLLSAEAMAHAPGRADTTDAAAVGGGPGPLPEDIGARAACLLLDEVARGGVTDSSHQGLALALCALGPEDLCKVRLGALSPHAVKTLRTVRDVLGVQFRIVPEAQSNTLFLTCIGAGVRPVARAKT